MRMYSKMPGSWYAVLSKTVNSHNVIDIQADVVHQKMSNLSYSVERDWPKAHAYLPDHGIHRSITKCKASQASPYLHVNHPAFYIGL